MCVDFIKGKCSRENCKYFHPPEHLVSHLKKLKLTNNALAAAAYAASNHNMALIGSQAHATHFSPIHQQPTYSFGLAANQFPLQHGATNSFSPYRLNNRSYGKQSIRKIITNVKLYSIRLDCLYYVSYFGDILQIRSIFYLGIGFNFFGYWVWVVIKSLANFEKAPRSNI